MGLRVAIASDHAGINLKKLIQETITSVSFTDFGPQDTKSVDYPDFAKLACDSIIQNKNDLAILICGSGIGMSIAANKINGIRAAHAESTITARLSREHNNANVLCIGERITGVTHALEMVQAWLAASFESRHQKRIDKISQLEK
ncbi:MAG: ribose 5-phosphate isomerase B [Oligoflexia bacterium]|nr:ribose 5-phosphate isomerase B [Oligoflexia bacterium]